MSMIAWRARDEREFDEASARWVNSLRRAVESGKLENSQAVRFRSPEALERLSSLVDKHLLSDSLAIAAELVKKIESEQGDSETRRLY